MRDQDALFNDTAPGASRVGWAGREFASDEDQQKHFCRALEDDLRQRKLSHEPGIPKASLRQIVDASDPPWFTLAPNPWLGAFVESHGTPYSARKDDYNRIAHAGEFQASERHPVYQFHPYHTKVPPDVIKTLIEHYTNPGDLVLDGFCGSGMTGVAARESGRNAILVDLSPIAAFISGVNVSNHAWHGVRDVFLHTLDACEKEFGYLFETRVDGSKVPVNYYVWSDVFSCPECTGRFPFFGVGTIHHGNKVETRDSFPCPHCKVDLNVRRVKRIIQDGAKLKELVWVNAGANGSRINREPSDHDRKLAAKVGRLEAGSWYPTDPLNLTGYSARLAQLGDKQIKDVSRFLSKRNLIIFADLWQRFSEVEDASVRSLCRATLTSSFTVMSERQGYFGGGGGMSGNFYMPIVRMEKNPFDVLRRKVSKLEAAEKAKERWTGEAIVSCQSATDLAAIPSASIDYIYVDPPFGGNIIYSELNLVLEAWLKVRTNDEAEAVIDPTRNREAEEYEKLLTAAFKEFWRILKPGRWMTVEFHNTAAGVWNVIQSSIRSAGFAIEQIGVLDKGTTTILIDIRPGAAKHDLIISARKSGKSIAPSRNDRSVPRPHVNPWTFVEKQLSKAPVPFPGTDEGTKERQPEMLFNRLVAELVGTGAHVEISAADFYAELHKRFPSMHGMFFLADQVKTYRQRLARARQKGLFDTQDELF